MIPKLYIGDDLEKRLAAVKVEIEKIGLKNPHPDLLFFEDAQKLGVKEAKEVLEHLSLKPYSANFRGVVLISAQNLTSDAQNALLKILEEPPPKGVIILSATSENKLLGTVLSRCQVIQLNGGQSIFVNQFESEIERLFGLSLEERFKLIEELEQREEFLKCLINFTSKRLKEDLSLTHFAKVLLEAEKYANQNGNIRAILEYLMLNLKRS